MEGHSQVEKRCENKQESGRTGEGGALRREDAVGVGVEPEIKGEGGLRRS